MTQYITAVRWNGHNCRLAQVWVIGGPKVAEVHVAQDASLDEAWAEAERLYEAIVEAEAARDQRETIRSILADSYPI
jgi:hypothetical protein